MLIKFFSNPASRGYLRSIAEEFGESTNAVRVELNRLADANLLNSSTDGRTKVYAANTSHPLFPDLNKIVNKYLGFDHLLDKVLKRVGNLELAFVTDDYARGLDSGIIDLVLVGEVDEEYVTKLCRKAEKLIDRKVRLLVLTRVEYNKLAGKGRFDPSLILFDAEKEQQTA